MHTGPQDCDAQVGLNLMLPRGRVYPHRCFISLQIPSRGTGPDLMPSFFFFFPIPADCVEILLAALFV